MSPDLTDESGLPEKPAIAISSGGVVMHGSFAVGRVEPTDDGGNTIVLNLAWCRMAGLSVVVEADPTVDHKRNGIVLARMVDAQ